MSHEVNPWLPAVLLLGLGGLDVVTVAELAGEIELVVETAPVTDCPQWGVVAAKHCRSTSSGTCPAACGA